MKTRHWLVYALWSAATLAISMLILIPIPGTQGFISLLDAGIYSGSWLFGPLGGLWIGILSAGLLDFLSGYPQWMLFSILIHGVQGLIVGSFYKKLSLAIAFLPMMLASFWMIIGYVIAGSILYGFGAGIASIPSNIIQNLAGIIVAYPMIYAMKRHNKILQS